ncbi:MAG: ATP-binding protein [Synergistaceae bacterium]|nr:ATP-binding protein [Synergistaceae bacterium]
MIEKLIAEATECDYKAALEVKKPKSWLKSVSAFANGIGGTLFFGVADDREIVGLTDVQSDAETISRLIRERITPLPHFVLTPVKENGKELLILKIAAGRATPYYYKADGIMKAYIRSGNDSVPAPGHVLNELILKGTNQSFDSLVTNAPKDDYSFTLLEAVYLERTGHHFEATDYISFGLIDKNGFLTNAGRLLTDQHSVFNCRLFCTRWNGLEKGSIFDDALDNKEYAGGLIYLLQSGYDFIRNNSKTRFAKEARFRVDKPDYSDRAVTEALVNALIHRDFIIMGREIHIDMYDDRLEIQSPGGMFEGKPIQECDINSICSVRRNPVIADLFHRMKYMERRGSGLKKILSETAKLPGYTEQLKPEFYSTSFDFRVILKNVNYNLLVSPQVILQDTPQDNKQVSFEEKILIFCKEARSRREIAQYFGYKDVRHFSISYLRPLMEQKRLRLTIPDKPNSRNQKYIVSTAKKEG